MKYGTLWCPHVVLCELLPRVSSYPEHLACGEQYRDHLAHPVEHLSSIYLPINFLPFTRGLLSCFCAHCSSVPTVPLCPLFLCTHCSSVPTVSLYPLFLCTHCFSVPTVPLYPLFLCTHCSSIPTVSLCSLFLCAHCSSVPTVSLCPLFLCTHCFSVPTVPLYPLFLCAHCFSVPTVPLYPLFLCAHCSSVPTVSLYPLFLCAHCSSVPTVSLYPLFLYTHCFSVLTVSLCSLFLCAHCSSVPTVSLYPLFLYTHCFSVLTVSLCSLFSVPTVPLYPLFLCAHCFSVPTVPLCPLFPLCSPFLYAHCSSVPSTIPLRKLEKNLGQEVKREIRLVKKEMFRNKITNYSHNNSTANFGSLYRWSLFRGKCVQHILKPMDEGNWVPIRNEIGKGEVGTHSNQVSVSIFQTTACFLLVGRLGCLSLIVFHRKLELVFNLWSDQGPFWSMLFTCLEMQCKTYNNRLWILYCYDMRCK